MTKLEAQIRTIGSLSNDDGDVNKNSKKYNRFNLAKKTTFQHAFLYISLPSLDDYDMKMPIFMFS